jgi:chromosomal replication initiation ATPase DnaA
MEREIIGYLKKIPYSLEQLRKKSRKRDLLYHRFVAMYLLREKGYIIATIGRFLNRQHSDVIHACKQVDVMQLLYMLVTK